MSHPLPLTRLAAALALAIAGAVSLPAQADAPITSPVGAAGKTTATKAPQATYSHVTVPTFAPLFATEGDARLYGTIAAQVFNAPIPDPRLVAKDFIKAHLGINGDDYVVAHFASAKTRKEGKPDQIIRLTDALMEAFPEHSRHTAFAGLADAVGGLNGGGKASPSLYTFLNRMVHARSAMDYFSQVGTFLWSRTGPGYLYNTFVAKGNVIDTVYEDFRRLDDAFAVFRAGTPFARRPDFRLSRILDEFKAKKVFDELPYVKKLHVDFDAYWKRVGHNWPLLARYRFVEQARHARASGVLTQEQYEQVMAGGASNVPLDGPIKVWQLRAGRPRSVQVRHFDIHGYTSSDLLRFVSPGKGEVLYIPEGKPAFVAFSDEADLRRWVVKQANDPRALDDLMSRFSLYDQQDGVFWSGVKTSLEKMASGRWHADSKIIDTHNAPIDGDPFEDMRKRTERRLRDDARMRVATSWEAWRTTLHRTVTLLGPLGYAPPLAIAVQASSAAVGLGLGIEREIDGRTFEERRDGLAEGLITFATAVPLGAAFDSLNTIPGIGPDPRVSEQPAAQGREQFALAPLDRIHGRIGYPLSPLRSPRLAGGDAEVPQVDELPSDHDEDAPSSQQGAAAPAIDEGYIAQVVPRSSLTRAYHLNERLRSNIEGERTRMDEFRRDSLRANAHGYLVSTDHAIVYRYDMRSPEELIANGGFGASGNNDTFGTFSGVSSMLDTPFTRGHGTMRAADRAYMHRLMDHASPIQPGQAFHNYAVWTEGREVATLSDNVSLAAYDPTYAEVHFPHDIPPRDIYIFGSGDPRYATAIADIFASPHVSTPYGVPLEALVEYLAGRLNIDLPNRFSEQRPAHYLELPSSSEGSMSDVQSAP